MRRQHVLTAGASVLACVLVVGCSASPDNDRNPEGQSVVSGSRSRQFTSLEQLSESSTAVIVATVGDVAGVDQMGDPLSPIPFTRYQLLRVKTLAGGIGGVSTIRQVGGPGDRLEDAAELVSGRRYLLYVQPFVFADGKATGQVQVTGYAGAFREVPGTNRYARVDDGSPSLPAAVDEARAVATSARLGVDPSLPGRPTG